MSTGKITYENLLKMKAITIKHGLGTLDPEYTPPGEYDSYSYELTLKVCKETGLVKERQIKVISFPQDTEASLADLINPVLGEPLIRRPK